MGKKYFIASGKDHLGPFTMAELQTKQLNPDTQIWSNDLRQWTKVSDIDELQAFIIPVPPPTPEQVEVQIKKEKIKIKQSNIVKVLSKIFFYTTIMFIIFFLVIFIAIGGFNTNYVRNIESGAIEPYYSMRIFVNEDNLKSLLVKITLFWSFIFSVICFVVFFIRESLIWKKRPKTE